MRSTKAMKPSDFCYGVAMKTKACIYELTVSIAANLFSQHCDDDDWDLWDDPVALVMGITALEQKNQKKIKKS